MTCYYCFLLRLVFVEDVVVVLPSLSLLATINRTRPRYAVMKNLGNGQIPSFDVRQKMLPKRERRADTRTHSFSLQTSNIAFFLFLFFSFLLSVFSCPMQWSVHCVFSSLSSLLSCHTLCGERTMQKPHALEDSTTRWNGGALDIAITKLSNELALILFEHARQAWSLVKK